MDAFFASIEQRDFPELKGESVIVGGTGNRGVVAAASYEARKFGIKSAMPVVIARRLCPDAHFLKPRFHAYKEASAVIHSVFQKYSDKIEPLSLDEAYIDVSDNIIPATEIAKKIKNEIFQKTKLTSSAGVSFNKFFAKIASDMNKPDGLTIIRPENWKKFLYDLPIRKFYGVGQKTADKMNNLKIHSGKDLLQYSKVELTHYFGKSGIYYFNVIRGIDDREIISFRKRKSVGAERTYSIDLSGNKNIENALLEIANLLWERIVKADVKGRTLTLKIRYSDFETHTKSNTLNYYFQSGKEIENEGIYLLSMIEIGKKKVRLLGLTLNNLQIENDQPGLFDSLFI